MCLVYLLDFIIFTSFISVAKSKFLTLINVSLFLQYANNNGSFYRPYQQCELEKKSCSFKVLTKICKLNRIPLD